MKIPLLNLEIRAAKQPRPGPWEDFWYQPPSFESKTGVDINEDTALTSSAVWACVRVISETLAALPLHVYRRKGDSGKERAIDSPAYYLLHDAPNPEMTAMQFREVLQAHILLHGNAYAQIVWNMRGDPVALWPLRPDKMEPKRNANDELVYEYKMDKGEKILFRKEEIIHVPGLGFNGLIGYSPVKYACNAIGLGLAAEEYGARFFANDAMPAIALKHPNSLSKTASDTLKKSWAEAYGGLSNKHKAAVLEEGMDVIKLGIEAEKAQLIESRKFQITDIARIYRVPPHMIMDLERATFSNIEHQGIDFVTHTIMPWAIRWEQQINLKLLGGKFFAQHLMDGLLRGDIASRYNAYAVGIQNGWLCPNDVRGLENMNPIADGNEYLRPMNMVPLGTEPEDEQPTEDEVEQAARTLRKLRLIRRAQNA